MIYKLQSFAKISKLEFMSKILISSIGQVKKAGCLKIVHDKFKKEKKSDLSVLNYLDEFQASIKYNKELEHCKNKFAMVKSFFSLSL